MHSTITISNGDLKCNATTRDNQTLMYIEKPKKCITIIELDRCIRWQWASVRRRVFVTNQYFCFFFLCKNDNDNKCYRQQTRQQTHKHVRTKLHFIGFSKKSDWVGGGKESAVSIALMTNAQRKPDTMFQNEIYFADIAPKHINRPECELSAVLEWTAHVTVFA